jgi:hypothetical protein|tara:strand:+ start:1548 stop:1733 length:186 start_codon:yes stop_codon:yes gene_type:complete
MTPVKIPIMNAIALAIQLSNDRIATRINGVITIIVKKPTKKAGPSAVSATVKSNPQFGQLS